MCSSLVAPVVATWGLTRAMGLAGLLLIPAIVGFNHSGQEAFAAGNASPAIDEMAIREGFLSVKLRHAPMADVLLAIDKRSDRPSWTIGS